MEIFSDRYYLICTTVAGEHASAATVVDSFLGEHASVAVVVGSFLGSMVMQLQWWAASWEHASAAAVVGSFLGACFCSSGWLFPGCYLKGSHV